MLLLLVWRRCVKLTTRALLEVVQTGAKNIEITVVKPGAEMAPSLDNAEIAAYVDEIETKGEAAAATTKAEAERIE